MVGLADCADAILKLWEETHELPFGNKSSGTQQLVRTACKSFHARGSQQAGCSTQFRAYFEVRASTKCRWLPFVVIVLTFSFMTQLVSIS